MVMAVVIPEGAGRTSLDDGRIEQLTARLRVIARTCEQQRPIPSPSKHASASSVGQDFVDYRLPSGVRLLVIPDDTAAQLSVRALWLGGSRMDDARLSGASALIARLLPRGTRSRGAEPLDAEMADIAGTLEGISGADILGLRADFLASRWERGLELIADVLCNPLFAEEDVERERRVQLDLIRRRDEDPSALALRAFREALYGAHPYRQDGLGTLESVSALTRRRLLDHFRRSYKVATLTVAVVGAVSPARVAAKLQSLLGDSPSTVPAELPSPPKMPRRDAPLEITRFTPGSVAHVMLGYLGLRVGDPDRYALDVVAEILGGSSGGRLASAFQDGGIALGTVAVSYEAFEPGFFAVSAPVRPDADGDPDTDPIKAVVTRLRAQLARLIEQGVTPQELARARQLLVGRSALAFERRGAVAMALSVHGAFSETVASYRADSEELARVTLADVLRAARRVLVPAQEILVVVRPRQQEKPIVGINRISAEYNLR
jgi:zinc protease